jgi:hypothetical protein
MDVLKEMMILLYFLIKVLFIKQFAKKKRVDFYIISQKIQYIFKSRIFFIFQWQFISVKRLTFSLYLTELSQL